MKKLLRTRLPPKDGRAGGHNEDRRGRSAGLIAADGDRSRIIVVATRRRRRRRRREGEV